MEKAYACEKKYDGLRGVAHRRGTAVKVYSDEARDITDSFPTLVPKIRSLSGSDFIVDGELVPYKNGKPLGRREMMQFVTGKGPKDDSDIKYHVFDVLYLGKPLVDRPWHERKAILHKLDFSDRVKEVHSTVVKDPEHLRQAIKVYSNLPTSEGSMVKAWDSKYRPGGTSKDWVKFRTMTSFDFVAIKRNLKESGVYNYTVGVYLSPEDKNINPDNIVDVQGKKVLRLGNTFNTQLDIPAGSIISVLVEEVWRHRKGELVHYSIHKPRVKEARPDKEKSSTVADLDRLVVSKGVEVKMMTGQEEIELAKGEGAPLEGVRNFPDRMQRNIMETKGWKPYTLHWHLRGEKSVHSDLRLLTDEGILEGFSVFSPPSTDKPNEFKKGAKDIRCTTKPAQPKSWLKVEGESKAGEAGATEKKPAYFTIVSKGTWRQVEASDHKIVIELKSSSGNVRKPPLEEYPYAKEFEATLPDSYTDISGKWSFHIAHIRPTEWIMLVGTVE